MGDVGSVQTAVADAFRSDWGRVVGYLIRVTGNWDLAEECAQDAFAKALVRAKRKIQDAGIPYRIPPAHQSPDRLAPVLAVIYALFNEGSGAKHRGRADPPEPVRGGDPSRAPAGPADARRARCARPAATP